MKLTVVVIAVFAILFCVQPGEAVSCEVLGRSGCIASCMAQNCATGYCDSAMVCRCSRCGKGPGWK